MNDLISRQAAVDAVHDEFDGCLVWDESGQTTADEVERILYDLPSAELTPCDLCMYNGDCEDMRIYCPARGRETNGEV